MSNSRMVDAVNRLVGTLLTGSGEVFLPGVGTLYTERRPAQRVSKQIVLPPCRVVSFASQQRGASLVDEIATAGRVDAAQAAEIYQIWLSRTRKEETLTIEGVGELKFKNFTLAPEFDAVLNPLGHKPVKIKSARGFDWVLWVGITAIAFVALAGGYQYWTMNCVGKSEVVSIAAPEISVEPVAPADMLVPADSVTGNVLPEVPVSEPADSVGSMAPKSLPGSVSQTLLIFEPGHRYVVLGVFSTLENAQNAIANICQEAPQAHCRIYAFGDKFLVSPFESAESGACAEFIRTNGDHFSGMWTYTAR